MNEPSADGVPRDAEIIGERTAGRHRPTGRKRTALDEPFELEA